MCCFSFPMNEVCDRWEMIRVIWRWEAAIMTNTCSGVAPSPSSSEWQRSQFKGNISKEKHKQPGKKLRNNGIHCCIFMWFLPYLNHCSGATRPMGPSDKVQSKELCSGPLCHLLSEILGNHLIFLKLGVLNPMSKVRWENAYKFSKVI